MSHSTSQIPSTGDHPVIQMDDPEPGSTWFVSVAGSAVFIAIVAALAVLYFRFDERVIEEMTIDPKNERVEAMRREQRELLADYRPYDETTSDGKTIKRLRIPIDQAMQIVAKELEAQASVGAAEPEPTSTPAAGGAGTK